MKRLVLGLCLLGAPALAEARSESRILGYQRDHVWGTTVRFVVVDERAKVLDKDLDAGYVLFEIKDDDGKSYRGSLEIVTVQVEGAPQVKFVITLVDRPPWMELAMLKRLEAKLRADLGPPIAPPRKPKPPKDSDKPADRPEDKGDGDGKAKPKEEPSISRAP